MVKITEKVHCLYENEWQDVKAICQKIKKSADVLHELPMISKDLVNVILNAFFNALPMPLKDKLLSCA